MEEQEKIDMRNHLIDWIDTFLEDGIIPQVVNPKAIRSNYILKSKVKEKIEELETYRFTSSKQAKKGYDDKIRVLQELLEREGK